MTDFTKTYRNWVAYIDQFELNVAQVDDQSENVNSICYQRDLYVEPLSLCSCGKENYQTGSQIGDIMCQISDDCRLHTSSDATECPGTLCQKGAELPFCHCNPDQ